MLNNVDTTTKRKYVLLAILLGGVLLVVAASMIVAKVTTPDYKVDIVNQSSVKKENKEGVINQKDFDNVKKTVRTVAKMHYKISDNERIDARVRESTYTEKNAGKITYISFIMDVENMKVSYAVDMWHDSNESYHVDLKCTPTTDAKYPETFCIGTNFYSSIDSNFKDILPYREIEKGVQKFILRKVNNQAKLSLGVDAKCDDQKAIDNALAKVKSKIASYGLDPEQVPIETDVNVCRAFEEEQNRKDGGL